MSARIDSKPTYELRVLEFHNLDCQADHPAVHGSVLPVAVRVYRYIGCVTVR